MKIKKNRYLLFIVIAILAVMIMQVAGVSKVIFNSKPASTAKTLRVIPGGSIPDKTSTLLKKRKISLKQGETVRFKSRFTMNNRGLKAKDSAQIVCGIIFYRDGDRSWTIGTPYELYTFTSKKRKKVVNIERSFAAPQSDRYTFESRCHRLNHPKGNKVTAFASLTIAKGLKAGSATPKEPIEINDSTAMLPPN